MDNIELYINNRLADVDKNLNVRLNRQLINPAELNTKDSQYSYSLSLPATRVNNEIFGFTNVEEIAGKFTRVYVSELIIKGVRIFKGNFRLSGISGDRYKGNLYVPAVKSVKDIFGDFNLNQIPEFRIPFTDFADSVTSYNTQALSSDPPVIFPITLYGILPKISNPGSGYTDREIWDASVRLGMQDIPPSFNLLQILKHLFNSQGYDLQGSVFNDERISKIYFSYRNPIEYVQPWNYGRHAKIKVLGEWSSIFNKRSGLPQFEKGVNQSSQEDLNIYSVDLFDATNSKIQIVDDPGNNVIYQESTDENGKIWAQTQIRIPSTGFYKVSLNSSVQVYDTGDQIDNDPDTGIYHVGGGTGITSNNFTNGFHAEEIRLIRDRKKGDFGLTSAKLNGTFYRDNQPQNDTFDSENIPKYFPQIGATGILNLIDLVHDPKFLLGFSFGKFPTMDHPFDDDIFCQMQTAKPALSWNPSYNDETPARLAVKSDEWIKFGKLGNTEIIGISPSGKYEIDLINAPSNFAARGMYDDSPAVADWSGQGAINSVIWLEAGELLTVATVSPEGLYRPPVFDTERGFVSHELKFELEIEPFRTDAEWLKVDFAGNGTDTMDWNDTENYDFDDINLVGFLPSDMKANDFIDNVVKAFNLRLSQTDVSVFSLDIKQAKATVSNLFVDLDEITSLKDRENTPLGLPSAYIIGFTINKDEEGYFLTEDDGGGEFSTGAIEGDILEQKSSFSYNWFKNITKDGAILELPVISKHEVWTTSTPYPEAMLKRFYDLPIRFWYFDGLLAPTFDYGDDPMRLAKVSNVLPGLNVLNYKNIPKTLLKNFFNVLVDSSGHYTETEGYLTPFQYEKLDGSLMVKFNGDLYYVAVIENYDPSGRNKTKLKLIRKI